VAGNLYHIKSLIFTKRRTGMQMRSLAAVGEREETVLK
jgi:hypothetical protein